MSFLTGSLCELKVSLCCVRAHWKRISSLVLREIEMGRRAVSYSTDETQYLFVR